MRTYQIALAAALFATGAAGLAAPVSVQVLGPDGRPLAGAVVTLTAPGVPSPPPRGTYAMTQRNVAFEPHLLVVPVGATVSFPNQDRVRHHVYSFSQPKKFDLKLYGREESRTVTFDKPGAVALGCNIHDAMNGVIFVTATPWTAVTGADGRARMEVGAARGVLAVWHPSIRAKGNALAQPVGVPAAGLSTTLQVRR